MINIQIGRDGIVSGDVNSVAANDNDKYSQPIRILHPDFPNVIHKVRYRQGRVEASDILSGDDMMRFLVCGPGLVRLQYVAEDARTGQAVLTSSTFSLNVAKSHLRPSGCDPRHRLHTDSILQQELNNIASRLNEVGILKCNKSIEPRDFNKLLRDEECIAGILSTNSPEGVCESAKQYLVRIRVIDKYVIQVAQLLEAGCSAVFCRSGMQNVNGSYVWDSWQSLIHKDAATVVETDDINKVAIIPGQYVVVKNQDGSYSLYYDLHESDSDSTSRVLLSSNTNYDSVVTVTDSRYENNTYYINCNNVAIPYDGMVCVFLPQHSNKADVTNYINFNDNVSAIYVRTSKGNIQPLTFSAISKDIPIIMIYSRKRWIVNAALIIDSTEGVDKIVSSFDFDKNVFHDAVIPSNIERVNNKIHTISDLVSYTRGEYPTVEAVKAYVSSKLEGSSSSLSDRVVTSNPPSSVKDFLHVLFTYLHATDRLVFGSEHTALDSECFNEIDTVSLIELALRGIEYNNSKYVRTDNTSSFSYSPRLPDPQNIKYTSQELIDVAIKQGRAFVPNSWKDIMAGDIIVTADSDDGLAVYISTIGDKYISLNCSRTGDLLSLQRHDMDLPNYVLRFSLNFVNELYYFNLVNANYRSVTVSSHEECVIHLDQVLNIDSAYTVSFKVSMKSGSKLSVNLSSTEHDDCFEYTAIADINNEVIVMPLITSSTLSSVLIISNNSSSDIQLSDVSLHEGFVTPPKVYNEPLSSRESAGSSIMLYT